MSEETVDLDAFLSDDDTAPMTDQEFNSLGGFDPLDDGDEDLIYNGIAIDKGTAKAGHDEMVVRFGFRVNDPGRNNPAGRMVSDWIRFPDRTARATNPKLEQQFNISKGRVKQIVLAFLGGTGPEEAGDYPVTEDLTLLSPMKFIKPGEYQDMLNERVLTAHVVKQGPTYTSKGVTYTRKKIQNDLSNFRPYED